MAIGDLLGDSVEVPDSPTGVILMDLEPAEARRLEMERGEAVRRCGSLLGEAHRRDFPSWVTKTLELKEVPDR